MHLVFSPESRLDLIEIGDYIAQDNPKRAKTFIDEMMAHCQQLESFPQTGRLRTEIGTSFRSIVHGSYVIFYSVSENTVRIERVLHGSRDIARVIN